MTFIGLDNKQYIVVPVGGAIRLLDRKYIPAELVALTLSE
jgi:hypothetical protein